MPLRPSRLLYQSLARCDCGGLANDADDRKLLVHNCAAVAAQGLDLPVINIIIDIMKTMKKPSSRGSISTDEMRFQFGRVLQAAKAGRSLTLTYRGKPLARIVPLKPNAEISTDDSVFRLHELAEPLGPLTNAEIDAAIYGQ
jgi:prevent-host-death family protein